MDSLVQGTNDSSILSKYSMVCRGYFADDAIQHFVDRDSRRSPLIHLGYYARAFVMDRTVTQYIESVPGGNPQILSLGAGFDTTYFRLNKKWPNMSYFEVDLQDVVRNKISSIANSERLSSILQNDFDIGEKDRIKSQNYAIFVHDLSVVEGLENELIQMGFDFGRPTLVFSECAITYIDEEKSTNLIKWFAEKLQMGTFMNYEQFNPDDGFGRVMTSHFQKIQSPLKSLAKYKTLDDQRKRYLDAGWSQCQVYCIMDLLQQFLSEEEYVRIFKIEPFDEWEEFHLKCCHYSLAVASQKESISLKLGIDSAVSLKGPSKSKRVDVILEEALVERYGHSSVRLNDNGMLIIGGFGILPGKRHGRCKDALFVGKSPKNVLVSNRESSTWDSMHHTCTSVGDDEFMLIGGRTSPAKEVNQVPSLVRFTIHDEIVELTAELVSLEHVHGPPPRWRHSAARLGGSLFIFGGRNSNLDVMDDLWELKLRAEGRWKWLEKKISGSERPCNRFSHAMTCGGEAIYVSGGLSSKLAPLNDIWQLQLNQGVATWKELKPQVELAPVYSHEMHWYKGKLLLLGGVNTSAIHQPGFTIFDLQTLVVTNYSFKLPNDGPVVMLHNFSSELMEDEPALYCYGGGGNCFSFGTHFNTTVVKIMLKDLI